MTKRLIGGLMAAALMLAAMPVTAKEQEPMVLRLAPGENCTPPLAASPSYKFKLGAGQYLYVKWMEVSRENGSTIRNMARIEVYQYGANGKLNENKSATFIDTVGKEWGIFQAPKSADYGIIRVSTEYEPDGFDTVLCVFEVMVDPSILP